MFNSSRQKLTFALVILLGAMGSSAAVSAASESEVYLPDELRLAYSAQLAMNQVNPQAENVRLTSSRDASGAGPAEAVMGSDVSEDASVRKATGGFIRCE